MLTKYRECLSCTTIFNHAGKTLVTVNMESQNLKYQLLFKDHMGLGFDMALIFNVLYLQGIGNMVQSNSVADAVEATYVKRTINW